MTKRKNKRKPRYNLFNLGGNLFADIPLANTPNMQIPGQQGLMGMNQLMSPNLQLPNMQTAPQMGGTDIMGGIGSAIGGVGTILNAGLANSKIADTSGIEANINAKQNKVVGATTNDSLMEEWSGMTKLKDDYTRKSVRGVSGGQMAANTIGAVGSGVASGAMVGGPIGGIVGGVVGLGSSIAGIFTGRKKARRKARRLNAAAKEANSRAVFSLQDKANNIDTQNDLNMLANFSAYGGPLGISALGSEYMAQSLNNQRLKALSTQRIPSMPSQIGPLANINAQGGHLGVNGGDFSNGITIINEGGTHEENPYQGVQVGMDEQGIPNLVEEGEVIYNDYVFSDRIGIPNELKERFKFKGNTFAKAAEKAQKESEERPHDPISQRGLEDTMNKLQQAQEFIKQLQEVDNPQGNTFAKGGKKRQTWTRYAPIVGSGIGALSGIFEKPDYSGADSIDSVDLNPALVGASPIGNYLGYSPLDRDFYLNRADKQASSTRDALLNTSGGNRLNAQAGILAADFNYGQNLGTFARQAEEYNTQQKERVGAFNKATNMFNAEQGLKADSMNAHALNDANRMRLSQRGTSAQMRQGARDQGLAMRSANMSSLLQGLGDIGAENEQRNWLNSLAESGVLMMNTDGEYTGGTKKKSHGGKIKRNKKKGFTYG